MVTGGRPSRPVRYVALLRAVNVAKRSLSVEAMRSVFEGLGFEDVATYLQTGNVRFASKLAKDRASDAIESAILEEAGLHVRALLRTATELKEIVDANPLVTRASDPKTLHVTFFEGSVDGDLGLERTGFLPDEFAVFDREVYLFCPGGYGRTKLNNAFFERRSKMVATTRNWRTVSELSRMASA